MDTGMLTSGQHVLNVLWHVPGQPAKLAFTLMWPFIVAERRVDEQLKQVK
jgi:hypothetical protein